MLCSVADGCSTAILFWISWISTTSYTIVYSVKVVIIIKATTSRYVVAVLTHQAMLMHLSGLVPGRSRSEGDDYH